ncbi:MAG: bifunctional glutamate N-acetyltransferase/amino-acid acetyltransferase ArgJ [Proteobacteria bacterium]|nr:MAG: bifunctional glutamate N-acetyltransferase/amino-acid acetyltransferase ArgJ [Pseudomonadota bacterium]
MNKPNLSPLAPASFPPIPRLKGVRSGVVAAGVKYHDRVDVWLAELAAGTTVAGVFTRSRAASAPVDWCREILGRNTARAILVNSGNANAFTGVAGREAVLASARAIADRIGCDPEDVFIASTGVIGEPLPVQRMLHCFDKLNTGLGRAEWVDCARAIMTTDTFPKGAVGQCTVDGKPVAIAGICKGSGMIEPDMGTMLGFVFTDLAISQAALQQILVECNEESFNVITVDSDTSTSDTVLLAATGAAGNELVERADDPRIYDFRSVLLGVMQDLAKQVVRDGEGASKFITIVVTGAEDDRAARVIAKSIANSPLVKTAIAGEDANWGRVVMAVGKAGERADRDKLSIRMGGVEIASEGQPVVDYNEKRVFSHLQGDQIAIDVDVGVGPGVARVWTCDLTEGYIRINADYRS